MLSTIKLIEIGEKLQLGTNDSLPVVAVTKRNEDRDILRWNDLVKYPYKVRRVIATFYGIKWTISSSSVSLNHFNQKRNYATTPTSLPGTVMGKNANSFLR